MWPFDRWRRKKGIRPYGDRRGDGIIQLAFTLPVPADRKACEAARLFCRKLTLEDVEIVSMEGIGKEFSSFIIYGKAKHDVDYDCIELVEPDYPHLGFDDLNRTIKERIGRPLTVVGATLGRDAYALAMDTLISAQGFSGHCGLEAYPGLRVSHLRGTVSGEALAVRARELKADAILLAPSARPDIRKGVSHLNSLRECMSALKGDKALSATLVSLCVDTHVSDKEAVALGYAAAFTPKSLPSQVANAIVHHCLKRLAKAA